MTFTEFIVALADRGVGLDYELSFEVPTENMSLKLNPDVRVDGLPSINVQEGAGRVFLNLSEDHL